LIRYGAVAWTSAPVAATMSCVDTAQWYRQFAEQNARGLSPTHERLAPAVSRDEELLSLVDTLPSSRRQPNTSSRSYVC
jgi:hypothetical protein